MLTPKCLFMSLCLIFFNNCVEQKCYFRSIEFTGTKMKLLQLGFFPLNLVKTTEMFLKRVDTGYREKEENGI